MSNHNNEAIMEGLLDEFYDDPQSAIEWLVDRNYHVGGLSEDEIADLYVKASFELMGE